LGQSTFPSEIDFQGDKSTQNAFLSKDQSGFNQSNSAMMMPGKIDDVS
jgi:hypothetical protein